MDVLISGRRVRLNPAKIIGSGGEAEVYDIGGEEVAKVFKSPAHPDFAMSISDQKSAETRIQEHQQKLALWPKKLPKQVIGPTGLVTDIGGKKILGYTMPYLTGMEVLLKYGERKYREIHSISGDQVVDIFRHLHTIVAGVHSAGVVIGDFNDLNVLVDSSMQAFLVDADSMQFGRFMSRVFTTRFVDPLLCDPIAPSASLIQPHKPASDWYAYQVMLMQSLLYVGPYGGVHIPSDVTKKLKEWQRVQKRVTLFDPSVRYPKPAMHYSVLPDTLLEQFHQVFERDQRGEFPIGLLGGLRFTSCPICKMAHARSSCPSCQVLSPSIVREVITGSIEAMKVLDTTGRIIYATVQDGIPRYIYHENGAYYREGGREILRGPADPAIRLRIHSDSTLLARGGQVVIMAKDGSQKRLIADLWRGQVTVVDGNRDTVFAVQGGELFRLNSADMDYPHTLGSVLTGQTMIWVGDHLGLLYSRAGGLTQSYVFHTDGRTLGAEIDIPRVTGQVLDATTVFSGEYVWFLMAIDTLGQRLNRAYMFDQFGKLCGQAETTAGDGSWLSSIRGKCARGKQLFCPTDEGIVRVESVGDQLGVTRIFADTTRFVDSASQLLFGRDGIYSSQSGSIWRLRMQ